MILELLEFLFLRVAFPILKEVCRRRDIDPSFKRLSDDLFHQWDNSVTHADRKEAVRKLHELQKSK